MSGPGGGSAPSPGPWEAFWRRTGESAAFTSGSPQHEVLARFWSDFLERALADRTRGRLLDLACGNGAVARLAMGASMPSRPRPEVAIGVDNSLAALAELRARDGSVLGVVADARRIPLRDRSCDIVTSQFGIEYAGPDAVEEVARLLADGGVFAAVIHYRDGAMYRENERNLTAMKAMRDSGVLEAAQGLFRAQAAVRLGKSSRGALREADARLAVALGQVAHALAELGADVAGGAVQRLHFDIGHLQGRQRFHDPEEVVRWAALMGLEAEAYCGRMASMLQAAAGQVDIDGVIGRLADRGVTVVLRASTSLGHGSGDPAAWILIGERA